MEWLWDPLEIPPRTLVPGVKAKIASGEKVMLSLIALEPHAVVPTHSHPHEQIGILVSGELELTACGETRPVPRNGMYLFPGGTPHAAKAGPEGAVAVEAFSPPREEYNGPGG
ncbi:MAG: cupin domain-containing protein [Thermodesulfobacteriota bacterium]